MLQKIIIISIIGLVVLIDFALIRSASMCSRAEEKILTNMKNETK